MRPSGWMILAGAISLCPAFAQPYVPSAPVQEQRAAAAKASGPLPAMLTFRDALARAQRYEPQFIAALNTANLAREDVVQARAALYPALGARSDYLNTQGNGKLPSGRFVTN